MNDRYSKARQMIPTNLQKKEEERWKKRKKKKKKKKRERGEKKKKQKKICRRSGSDCVETVHTLEILYI